MLTDNSPMPYGTHKGKPMVEVPDDYLRWLYDNNKCDASVKQYIESNADVLKIKIKK